MNLPMQIEDIVREYVQAKDKNKQVEILADMNLCSRQEILDILTRNGAVTGLIKKKTPPQKKTRKKQVEWSAELTQELLRLNEQKVPKKEIAERLGVDELSVKNKLARMKTAQSGALIPQSLQQEAALASPISERLARAALYADLLAAAEPDRLRGGAQSMSKMAAEINRLLWQIYEEFAQKTPRGAGTHSTGQREESRKHNH